MSTTQTKATEPSPAGKAANGASPPAQAKPVPAEQAGAPKTVRPEVKQDNVAKPQTAPPASPAAPAAKAAERPTSPAATAPSSPAATSKPGASAAKPASKPVPEKTPATAAAKTATAPARSAKTATKPAAKASAARTPAARTPAKAPARAPAKPVAAALKPAPKPVAKAVPAAKPSPAPTAPVPAAAKPAANGAAHAASPPKPVKPALGEGRAFSAGATFDLGTPPTELTEINKTVMDFVRGESDAALAHFQALSKVRSPSEFVRLQFGEFQRAADASLTCLGQIARSAGRLAGLPRLK